MTGRSAEGPFLVAGGGIGGLAVAIALGIKGFRVRVLEQEAAFGAIGYGIQLGPNVFPMLARLGIESEIRQRAYFPSAVTMLDALDGRELARIPARDSVVRRFGHPYAVILRTDLHEVLLDACRRLETVSLEPNVRATAFEETDGGVRLTLADGRVLQGAALIGADGLRSATRAQIRPEGEPDFTGYVAHRTVVPVERVPSGIFRDDVVLWAGPGCHIVHYPLRDARLFNIVAVLRTPTHRERLGADDYRREVSKTFDGALPALKTLLDLVDLERRWVLSDRYPIRQWTRGRVALLGDAAHPTLQSIAQGACMAIEDAVCLAEHAARHPGDLARAFARYGRVRHVRTARVQLESRHMWEVYHVEDIARDVRNETYAVRSADEFYDCLEWLWGGFEPTPDDRAEAVPHAAADMAGLRAGASG